MSTTYNPHKRPTTNLGRYRHIVVPPQAGSKNPNRGNEGVPKRDCEELIRLAEKVAGLETWRMSTVTDLKAVLEVIQQAKVLMSLSLVGGVLSLVSLILTVVSMLRGTD